MTIKLMRHYSIETSFSERGPWEIIDTAESDSLRSMIEMAKELVPDRTYKWVRLVPNDCEEDATIIRPVYR